MLNSDDMLYIQPVSIVLFEGDIYHYKYLLCPHIKLSFLRQSMVPSVVNSLKSTNFLDRKRKYNNPHGNMCV